LKTGTKKTRMAFKTKPTGMGILTAGRCGGGSRAEGARGAVKKWGGLREPK